MRTLHYQTELCVVGGGLAGICTAIAAARHGTKVVLIQDPAFSDYRIICIPFVDFDGVSEGDQGKSRTPYDHNRDYDPEKEAIYPACRGIRALSDALDVAFAFDFHAPWHLGGENDTVFLPIKSIRALGEIQCFSRLFEEQNGPDSLPHYAGDDLAPDSVRWNRPGLPTCSGWFDRKGAVLPLSLETPYFVASGVPFSPERATATGRAFAAALKEYIKRPV